MVGKILNPLNTLNVVIRSCSLPIFFTNHNEGFSIYGGILYVFDDVQFYD